MRLYEATIMVNVPYEADANAMLDKLDKLKPEDVLEGLAVSIRETLPEADVKVII